MLGCWSCSDIMILDSSIVFSNTFDYNMFDVTNNWIIGGGTSPGFGADEKLVCSISDHSTGLWEYSWDAKGPVCSCCWLLWWSCFSFSWSSKGNKLHMLLVHKNIFPFYVHLFIIGVLICVVYYLIIMIILILRPPFGNHLDLHLFLDLKNYYPCHVSNLSFVCVCSWLRANHCKRWATFMQQSPLFASGMLNLHQR